MGGVQGPSVEFLVASHWPAQAEGEKYILLDFKFYLFLVYLVLASMKIMILKTRDSQMIICFILLTVKAQRG